MNYEFKLAKEEANAMIFGVDVINQQSTEGYLIKIGNTQNLSVQRVTDKIDTSLFQYSGLMPYFDPVRFVAVAEIFMSNLYVTVEVRKVNKHLLQTKTAPICFSV